MIIIIINTTATTIIPAGIYLFKANNRNTSTRCEVCSKLGVKTSERRHDLALCLFLTLKKFHILFQCFYC